MSNRRIIMLIAFLLALRFATLGLWELTDPTEARYAEISRQIVLKSNWVVPKIWINGELIPFLGKPPLFFWLTASSMKLFGFNAFSARFAAFLSAAGILLLMSELTRRYFQPRQRILALLITILCPLFFFLSGAVLVDMTLSLGISGAVLAYFAFLKEESVVVKKRWSIAVFVFLGIGFLTKGPVAIAVFGMPVFCWHLLFGRWNELKHHAWLLGGMLFLGISIPWFILCEQREPGFIKYFFINENILRYTVSNYQDKYGSGHKFPHGAALVMMALSVAPWLFLAFSPFSRYFKNPIQKLRADPWRSFFLLGFVVNTLFWCFARQLLITYMLPMVPLFACWLALELGDDKNDRPLKWTVTATIIAYLIVLPAGIYGANEYASTAPFFKFMRERHADGKYIVSACRKTPYSAYFNNKGELDIHPKESCDGTIERCLALYPQSKPLYFLCRRRYLKRIPTRLMKSLEIIKQSKAWVLYKRKTT